MDEDFGDRIRAMVRTTMTCPTCQQPAMTMGEAAAAIGMPLSTFHHFMRGGALRLTSVDKVVAWLERQPVPA